MKNFVAKRKIRRKYNFEKNPKHCFLVTKVDQMPTLSAAEIQYYYGLRSSTASQPTTFDAYVMRSPNGTRDASAMLIAQTFHC